VAAELSKDLGFQDVILEGDCLQVINAIKDRDQAWSPYGQIIMDVRVVLNSRRSWITSHVKRDSNKAAHELARAAVKNQSDCTWIEDVPPCIFNLVSLERLAL
jgi:ribonuclease HI